MKITKIDAVAFRSETGASLLRVKLEDGQVVVVEFERQAAYDAGILLLSNPVTHTLDTATHRHPVMCEAVAAATYEKGVEGLIVRVPGEQYIPMVVPGASLDELHRSLNIRAESKKTRH